MKIERVREVHIFEIDDRIDSKADSGYRSSPLRLCMIGNP